MMALTENLVSGAAMEVLGTTQVEYQGTPIDLTAPWRRVTMSDLVKEAMGGFDFDALASWIDARTTRTPSSGGGNSSCSCSSS